jgi:hypothetical protein
MAVILTAVGCPTKQNEQTPRKEQHVNKKVRKVRTKHRKSRERTKKREHARRAAAKPH